MAVALYQRLAEASPAVNEEPLDWERRLVFGGGIDGLESAREVVGERPVFALHRSRSRADLGYWFTYPRIWVFVMEGAVLLGAWTGKRLAPQPFLRPIVGEELTTVLYNDITGELLLDDVHPTEVPGLRVEPATGYSLVAHIERYSIPC